MNAFTLTTSRWLKILAVLCLVNAAGSAWGQAVPLNTAGSFGVLAGQAISNTGPTIVTGNLGIFPGNASSVTGFPPGIVIGTTHFADAVAQQAQNDLTTAYNTLAGRACTTTISGDLGGRTLFPGVYCSASTMGLTGTLTLDAQGDPNAIFIFQVGSALTTASASAVQMINGGQNCNVFWQIGSSATLGTTTAFIGNLIAFSSITLTTGATTSGRVLARNGAVTIDSGMISVCQLAAAGPPSISKAFAPSSISAGGVSTLTITLSNPEAMPSTLTAPLVDNLPAGITIAALPNVSTTCGGTGAPLATPGGSSVTLPAGRTIPANGSCTLIVNVTGTVAGSYINIIPIGALQTNTGNNLAPATATLLITQLVVPSISKAFAPSSISAGGVSTLTITITNPQAAPSTLTAPLIDNLPAGVTIAAVPDVSTTCGGTGAPLATPGGSSVTLPAGRTIPANGSCTLIVNVTGTVAGSYINIIPIGALQTNTGNNLAPATATLLITQAAALLAVPMLSTWALLLLSATLIGFGVITVARRV